MCVSTCTTTAPSVGFLLTGGLAGAAAVGTINAGGASTCTYDFLAVTGGFNPVTGLVNNRYCGGALLSASVCSMFKLLFIIWLIRAIH
jgi:hypothetical protein